MLRAYAEQRKLAAGGSSTSPAFPNTMFASAVPIQQSSSRASAIFGSLTQLTPGKKKKLAAAAARFSRFGPISGPVISYPNATARAEQDSMGERYD